MGLEPGRAVQFIEKILQHFWTELLSHCKILPLTNANNDIHQVQLADGNF